MENEQTKLNYSHPIKCTVRLDMATAPSLEKPLLVAANSNKRRIRSRRLRWSPSPGRNATNGKKKNRKHTKEEKSAKQDSRFLDRSHRHEHGETNLADFNQLTWNGLEHNTVTYIGQHPPLEFYSI